MSASATQGNRNNVKNFALNKKMRRPDLRTLVLLKLTTFSKLILRKIIKIAATRCHILQLYCTKFDFGWGSTPNPAGERIRPSSWI